MKVLDLFAGAGGFSLGFEDAGFDVTGVERNADCCATYNVNLRGTCIQDTTAPEYNFPKADIVIGGPPCQPFLVRGRQLGARDARDGLHLFIATIRSIRPKVCVFENVRGLYGTKYFEDFTKMIQAEGFFTNVSLLNCADYGVPQNRWRVVLVGHRGSYKSPEPGKRVTAEEAIHNVPAEEPIYLTASMNKYIAKYEKASGCKNPRDLYPTRPALCAATVAPPETPTTSRTYGQW